MSEEQYITFELFSKKQKVGIPDGISRYEQFKLRDYNWKIDLEHEIIIRKLKRGVLLYTSIISPLKEEKFKFREIKAFNRAKTIIRYINEKFPVRPSVLVGRNVRYPPVMYLCRWCGKILPFTHERFCPSYLTDCSSKYDRKYTWEGVRDKIMYRDNFICQICGRKGEFNQLQVDHIKPVGIGGDYWDEDNLRTICSNPCHKEKTKEDIRLISNYNTLFRELNKYFQEKKAITKRVNYWKKIGMVVE